MWLIVDDGSTDNTKQLVESFINENKITINYHWKQNGGKHTAHNVGLELCDTELFVCVDSDDSLKPFAISAILIICYFFTLVKVSTTSFYIIEVKSVKTT